MHFPPDLAPHPSLLILVLSSLPSHTTDLLCESTSRPVDPTHSFPYLYFSSSPLSTRSFPLTGNLGSFLFSATFFFLPFSTFSFKTLATFFVKMVFSTHKSTLIVAVIAASLGLFAPAVESTDATMYWDCCKPSGAWRKRSDRSAL